MRDYKEGRRWDKSVSQPICGSDPELCFWSKPIHKSDGVRIDWLETLIGFLIHYWSIEVWFHTLLYRMEVRQDLLLFEECFPFLGAFNSARIKITKSSVQKKVLRSYRGRSWSKRETRILACPPTPTLAFPLQAVHYLPLTITALIHLPTCLPIDVTPAHLLDDLSFNLFF